MDEDAVFVRVALFSWQAVELLDCILFERFKGRESAVCARTLTITGAPEAGVAGQTAGRPPLNYCAVEDGYFAQAGGYGADVCDGSPFTEDAKDRAPSSLTGLIQAICPMLRFHQPSY